MYWAIGAPECFVQRGLDDSSRIIEDSAEEPIHAIAKCDGLATTASSTASRTHDIPANGDDATAKTTDYTSSGDAAREEKEVPISDHNIVGLRLSRNGQLFATITQTILSIWQTRVCYLC